MSLSARYIICACRPGLVDMVPNVAKFILNLKWNLFWSKKSKDNGGPLCKNDHAEVVIPICEFIFDPVV